jgi:CheY-like chemotaxis protein
MVKKRILVIEDDEGIRSGLQELLESEGYEVQLASDGKVGLDWLTQADPLPCLIILDLMMPVLDGFGFREAQEKEARLASIPVVIMTADGHIQAKRIRTRAADFIRKPVDIFDLLDKVGRLSA